jgi:hypothetical protein
MFLRNVGVHPQVNTALQRRKQTWLSSPAFELQIPEVTIRKSIASVALLTKVQKLEICSARAGAVFGAHLPSNEWVLGSRPGIVANHSRG